MRFIKITLIVIIVLVLVKIIWVLGATWNIGSWEDEKNDILHRSDFLANKVITTPAQLLAEMPEAIGPQFQGEWALYSCSMLAKALSNISTLYPETKEINTARTDSLISLVLSPEIRMYDTDRWGEDAIDSLDGNNSHISYLSHLAWMIGNYKTLSGDTKYDHVYEKICGAMNRRISSSPILNLPTYPGECIYLPDMLVAIVALNDFAKANNGRYSDTVNNWIERAKAEWLDSETGLLASFLDYNGDQPESLIKGSYTALNCYYLALADHEFGKSQYEAMKKHFLQNGILAGIREYSDRAPIIDFDIDAGPILFGLSPSGTAFAIGPATIYADHKTRKRFLRTAEIAGHTVGYEQRHYMLANLALVGEAITLAMRTSI